MSLFYFVRHAHFPGIGQTIAGRQERNLLSETGRGQLGALTDYLSAQQPHRILCSPLERTRETAAPLGERLRLPVEVVDELLEVDFGAWTGSRFDALAGDDHFRRYNSFRSGTHPPQGELIVEIQARLVRLMLRLRDELPEGRIVLFSHGDVIRAALLYWLGMPIDFIHRLEISAGSVSCLELTHDAPRLLNCNCVSGKLPASS